MFFTATPNDQRSFKMSTQRESSGAAGANKNEDSAPAPDAGRVPATAFTVLVEATTNAITVMVNIATATLSSVAAVAKKTKTSKYSNQPL